MIHEHYFLNIEIIAYNIGISAVMVILWPEEFKLRFLSYDGNYIDSTEYN